MEAPSWVEDLVRCTMRSLALDAASGVWNYLVEEPSELHPEWQVDVYPTPYQIEGGRDDGAEEVGGFDLDVGRLLKAFDRPPYVLWVSPSDYEEPKDGPRLAIEGNYRCNPVLLRVYVFPCIDVEATKIYNILTTEIRDRAISHDQDCNSD